VVQPRFVELETELVLAAELVLLIPSLNFGNEIVPQGLKTQVSQDRYQDLTIADHLTPASDVASRLRLRSSNRHQLIVPRCRLNTYSRQAFSVAGPTVWNSLPCELRDPVCGFDSFKQFLKTILFSLY